MKEMGRAADMACDIVRSVILMQSDKEKIRFNDQRSKNKENFSKSLERSFETKTSKYKSPQVKIIN